VKFDVPAESTELANVARLDAVNIFPVPAGFVNVKTVPVDEQYALASVNESALRVNGRVMVPDDCSAQLTLDGAV
jgi:hypothetical protein